MELEGRMGLFYNVPNDLKNLESMVMAVGQEMAMQGKGYDTSAILADMMPDTISLMRSESARLAREGRAKDLAQLKKHLLGVGKFMDNAPYNRMFAPFVRDNLNA